MKMIIDIPESIVEHIKDGSYGARPYDRLTLITAVLNGASLPKGHGKLFILDKTKARKYFTNFNFSLQNWISEVDISKATLKVIEADGEAEE